MLLGPLKDIISIIVLVACRPGGPGGAAMPTVITQVTQDAEGRLMPRKGSGGGNYAAAAAAGGWNAGKHAANELGLVCSASLPSAKWYA
jgi:hypothetical protein